MNQELLNSKLKKLIQVCKETENYKKLAIVCFILISNLVNEIGLKLGARSRDREKDEKIYEYMKFINQVFLTNLNIQIFQEKIVNTVQRVEILFLRNRGEIPLTSLKIIFGVYFDLRSLEVPNFYKIIKEENFLNVPNLSLFSFLFTKNKYTRNNDTFKSLILHKVKQKESEIQKNLKSSLNQDELETAFYLKKIKEALNNKNNKILIQGALKDNVVYRLSKKGMIKYFILGLFIFFLSIGIIILIEMYQYPNTTNTIGPFLLCTIFPSIFIFFFYQICLKKRDH